MFTDRDGKYQLASLAESAFDPLARTCRFMLTEEAHHMFVGDTGVNRVVRRTAELMNEPMTIERKRMFQTRRARAEAINAVGPDMAGSISDIGEGAVLPAWVTKIGGGGIALAVLIAGLEAPSTTEPFGKAFFLALL